MTLRLLPRRQGYLPPDFGQSPSASTDAELDARIRQPVRIGAIVIGVFVLGFGLWAAVTPLSSGISAPAEVRADSNRKTMRSREGGTVRQIRVKEGEYVRAQQPLLTFDDVEAKAAFDVYQSQHDVLLAQAARFSAEAAGRTSLSIPQELRAKAADPRVAQLIQDQELLFSTRLQLHQSQAGVLDQRIAQLETQITGLQAQVDSVNEQARLTEEELEGYRKLNAQGFAPKTLILRYERQLAELKGRRGQLNAEIARIGQQMGETRIQLVSLRNQRASEAAEGVRDTQTRLADVVPRLATARQNYQATVVRAPVNGYVFNLTQFTVGGVVAPGEVVMDIVPAGVPLTVTAMVKPEDVDQVKIGMDARVRLTGLNQRFSDDLQGKVAVVSADRITNQQTGDSYYRVDLQLRPTELKKLRKGVELTPGMPAQALIVTGQRTVLGYLTSPITETLHDALREE